MDVVAVRVIVSVGERSRPRSQAQLERRARRRDADEFEKGGFMTLDSVGDVDGDDAAGRARRPSGDDDEPQVSATQKLSELENYDGKTAVGELGQSARPQGRDGTAWWLSYSLLYQL